MINKRGDAALPTNKLVGFVLGGMVLVIVVVGIIILGIPAILELFPGLNSTSINKDLIVNGNIAHYSLGEVKVLLDDGEGKCIVLGYVDDTKPMAEGTYGFYGVWKGKLIYKSGGVWKDIDDKVPTDNQIWLRDLKGKMGAAVNSLKMVYDVDGKTYPVSFDSYRGLLVNINGINYVWDGKNYVDGVEISDDLLGIKAPEASRIKFLMINSLPKIDNKQLVFDIVPPTPMDKPIYISYIYEGKYYGVSKGSGSSTVSLVYKTADEISKTSAWNVIGDTYLYDDTLWKNMMIKKSIKDDLIKICSSK